MSTYFLAGVFAFFCGGIIMWLHNGITITITHIYKHIPPEQPEQHLMPMPTIVDTKPQLDDIPGLVNKLLFGEETIEEDQNVR